MVRRDAWVVGDRLSSEIPVTWVLLRAAIEVRSGREGGRRQGTCGGKHEERKKEGCGRECQKSMMERYVRLQPRGPQEALRAMSS